MIEWRWKCKNCAHEFMLSPARIPAPCKRCGGEWFLKVGETGDDQDEEREPRPGIQTRMTT